MTQSTPSSGSALAWGAATHPGQLREVNEDRLVAEPMVFGVADGMGGHQAGEVASQLAAATLRDRLADGATNLDVVVAAVVEANASIFQSSHHHADQRGMGTTLTALVVLRDANVDVGDRPSHARHDDRLALVNVGDSRTYIRRNGALRRATIDHSYVQELVDTGHISEAEARNHPRRNIVTRALGIEPNVRVDTWTLPMVRGDRYVLCSDGLVDEVDDAEIETILAEGGDAQTTADALVAAANLRGGRDNVTVVVVDVIDGADPEAADPQLEVEPVWSGDVGGADLLAVEPATVVADSLEPDESPRETSLRRRRRFTVGTLLFVLAAAVIATVTIVLALVVIREDEDDAPLPSTTITTPTADPTSTTTASTASTAPSTARPSTTARPTTVPTSTT